MSELRPPKLQDAASVAGTTRQEPCSRPLSRCGAGAPAAALDIVQAAAEASISGTISS
jgi:hypothetical protein